MTRAGIKTVAATEGTATRRLHLPGVVSRTATRRSGEYRVRIRPRHRGARRLGKSVVVGDVLASLYSPELAEAQTAFVAARAEHAAHDQRQARSQRLLPRRSAQ